MFVERLKSKQRLCLCDSRGSVVSKDKYICFLVSYLSKDRFGSRKCISYRLVL